jgi:hypothetical protein
MYLYKLKLNGITKQKKTAITYVQRHKINKTEMESRVIEKELSVSKVYTATNGRGDELRTGKNPEEAVVTKRVPIPALV